MERRGFHRSDFTGSEGPGLKKLRGAKLAADIQTIATAIRPSSLETLKAHMAAGRWDDAILTAARWGDLGDARDDILKGREAIMRPKFQRQLKRDPLALIEAAKQALIRRYGNV